MKSSELKQLIKEEIISILNESDISTYERREEEAKNFADKNFDSVSFMGYGFNELAPESFKGEFKIRSGEDFDEAMETISKKYKVDKYNSKDKKEEESFGDRDYLPIIKIIGIE
jgi:protein-tyrosine-phosphatase